MDGEKWLEKFNLCEKKDEKKKLRKELLKYTFKAINENGYYSQSGFVELSKEKLEYSSLNTKYYYKFLFTNDKKNSFDTKIQVIDGDCIDVCLHFKKKDNTNPLLLNMASDKTPGTFYK
jgi:hypothetical protein